jgi:hypothetical protein
VTSSGLEPKSTEKRLLPHAPSIGSDDGHRQPSSPVQAGAGRGKGSPRPAALAPRDVPSRSGLTSAGNRTAESMRERHQDWADAQTTTSSCFFCDWTFTGTAAEGRDEARAHRQDEHPEACIRKPRLRKRKISKKQIRSAGKEEQIAVDAAEARRIRHEREQSEMLAKIERGRARDAALDTAATGV